MPNLRPQSHGFCKYSKEQIKYYILSTFHKFTEISDLKESRKDIIDNNMQ